MQSENTTSDDTSQLADRLVGRVIGWLNARGQDQQATKTRRELALEIAAKVGERLSRLESGQDAGEWNATKNNRRCDLIDKEIDGTLTPAESVELETLQAEAVAYRDRVAPPPMETARELHLELLQLKRQSQNGVGSELGIRIKGNS